MHGTRRIVVAGFIGTLILGVQAASAGELPTLVREVPAPEPALYFGFGVTDLGGDVDGDGVPDFVVACADDGWGTPISGVVVSGATGATLAEAATGFGFDHLAATGDLTGDGVPDWAATWSLSGPGVEELLTVMSGAALGAIGPEDVVYELRYDTTLSVSGGDGRVVVGLGSGRVLFLQGAVPNVQAELTGSSSSGLAASVWNVGDWDGDGADDYAIGAPLAAGRAGRLYVVTGAIVTASPTDIESLPPDKLLLRLDGPQPGDEIGRPWTSPGVANIGDLIGDGVPDLAVGAPSASTGGLTTNGSALLYDVKRDPSGLFMATLLHRLDGQFSEQGYGVAVVAAGDLDGDGHPDVGVSTGSNWSVCFYSGASFEELGCLSGGGGFGASLAMISDLEIDTRINMVVGAPHVNHPSSRGSVYVYNGGWRTIAGDIDGDGDVDLNDFLRFQQCFAGSGNAVLPGCLAADLDGDSDVDLGDFVVFQLNFTGSQ